MLKKLSPNFHPGEVAMESERHLSSGTGYADAGVRRHPRILFSVPITLRHLMSGGVRTSHGISLDISENGLGALVQGALQVGETVAIELPLEDLQLNMIAIVRHSSNVRSGFEFFGLSQEERAHLASVVGNA